MPESFEVALSKSLFREATSVKDDRHPRWDGPERIDGFITSPSDQRFLDDYGGHPVSPILSLPYLRLSDDQSVKEPAKSLVDWTIDCLHLFGKNDIFVHDSQKVTLPRDWGDTYADYVFTIGENVDANSVAAVLQIFPVESLGPRFMSGMWRNSQARISVASSYEFVSQIKRFDKGTRDIFRVELVNGESYVFKPYRPKDDENDRFEYIPEDELKVYNKFRHLQGKYIPICYGIVEMNSMSGLLLEDCSEKNL